jgi:hypothetical protein
VSCPFWASLASLIFASETFGMVNEHHLVIRSLLPRIDILRSLHRSLELEYYIMMLRSKVQHQWVSLWFLSIGSSLTDGSKIALIDGDLAQGCELVASPGESKAWKTCFSPLVASAERWGGDGTLKLREGAVNLELVSLTGLNADQHPPETGSNIMKSGFPRVRQTPRIPGGVCLSACAKPSFESGLRRQARSPFMTH